MKENVKDKMALKSLAKFSSTINGLDETPNEALSEDKLQQLRESVQQYTGTVLCAITNSTDEKEVPQYGTKKGSKGSKAPSKAPTKSKKAPTTRQKQTKVKEEESLSEDSGSSSEDIDELLESER